MNLLWAFQPWCKTLKLLTPELLDDIAKLPESEQNKWLFIEPHQDFRGAWYVSALDPEFFFDFDDILGSYSALFPHQLEEFKQRCEDHGYFYAFVEDPTNILEEYKRLSEPPPFSINSSLEGTVQGFLPWQVVGFNKLVRPDELRGGLCLWDTGTGKTVFVAMGILWHLFERKEADLALVVVKSNNKRDMQRKLKKLADIDSVIIDGLPAKRWEIYHKILDTKPCVAITNYEKFREDREFFEAALTGARVVIFWDEMPTKLKNRESQLYLAVKRGLYDSDSPAIRWHWRRPEWLRQYELTATPIETDPGNQFNCVRLIDPEPLGTVTEFEKRHVLMRDPFKKRPVAWTGVDQIGLKLNFMTHRVDKTHPDVAKYFPNLIEDTIYIDWNPVHRKLYDEVTGNALAAVEGEEELSILSMIMVLRMLCDAPSMVAASAHNREAFENLLAEAEEMEDDAILRGIKTGSGAALRLASKVAHKLNNVGHTKWERLREDLTERHPDSKVIVFSTWSSYIFPLFEKKLKEWGVSYVVYKGTQKERDDAKDYWRTHPECRVLVCSDAGSDSIDLPEADVVINFNLPTLYSRKYQRINRASRADSIHRYLYVYNYVMADSVEERSIELIEQRRQYHEDLVNMATQVMYSAALNRSDMIRLIGG
jgi:SNF2 family DNA or RNA helicase